jgi:hypothetical protein
MKRRASLVLLALAWLGPRSSLAFERSRDPFTGVCLVAERRELTFHLDDGCRVGGSLETCREAVESALEVWNQSGCSDVRLGLGGIVRRGRVESDVVRPEANIWLIKVTGHPGRAGPHPQRLEDREVGRSVVTYDRVTGRIVDADMLIEDEGLQPDALHNVVLHEAGHALGLGHSRAWSAVMFSTTPASPRIESLGEDDRAGLCELYPLGLPTPACGGGPVWARTEHGSSLMEDPGVGCASAGPAGGAAWLLLAVLGWSAVLRNRRPAGC